MVRPTSERVAFELFIPETILRVVMRETNRRLQRDRRKPFTFDEILAAVAILIRAGADKDNLSKLQDLYHPTDSRPFFRCGMSFRRLKVFLRYVSLDNKLTRRDRQLRDKLAAVRDVWTMFNDNLRAPYIPTAHLTVDEQLYGYRGYVPGRSYMPAKPK